jgi:outer membrane biosynthesis protein TonB
MNARLIVAMVSATLPALADAAEVTQDPGRITACSAIADAAARLACFDAESARLDPSAGAKVETPPPVRPAPESPAAPPAPPTTPPAATAGPTPTPKPTLGEEQLRRNEPAREAVQSLEAKIAETRRSTGGIYYVTLDNGQVWRHEEGSMAEYLRPGDAVTIQRAALGSYRLVLDGGRSKSWIRVTRVR